MGQQAISMICFELVIGELSSNMLFHVIDEKISYNVPWIHENGVILSTLYQCFKFYREGVKKVEIDTKKFTEVKSYFANAKFYTKDNII